MANNNAIFNAVIAGAGGANQERWIQSGDSASYAAYRTAVEAVATAVDAEIPAGSIGVSQQALMQSICQGIFAGRYPQASSYQAIALAIVALYTQLAGGLQPDAGASSDPIFQQLWLDTTKPDGGNGSIATPYNTWANTVAPLDGAGSTEPWLLFINQDIDATGVPIPDLAVGMHDVGCVKLQGVNGDANFPPATTLSSLVVAQQASTFELIIQDIFIGSLELPGGTTYLLGENSFLSTVTQSGTVAGISNLVNCTIQGFNLDAYTLGMTGGKIFFTNQVDSAVLDGVEFQDSASLRWSTALTLRNCKFRSGVQLLCSSNQPLNLDLDTWGAMRAASVTFPDTAPTLTITPWMPFMVDLPIESTDPVNPTTVATLNVGALSPPAQPSRGCIANFAVAVNTNLSVVGAFIDVNGDLNVLIRNDAGTTQNLVDPTYTVTYLPRVSP